MVDSSPVRVYVGADRSQALAVKVLEHSIKRHTKLAVEVYPMVDLPVRAPKDPRNGQRTGFSFSRFCIPKLAGYHGRAIYMDADMLVFKDIGDLWNMPFNGAKILIQEPLDPVQSKSRKDHGPDKRIRQCAVMLLNCDELKWNIENIIDDLDAGKYNYDQLMKEICILKDEEIGERIPFRWNSLEHFDDSTCLIHYTDMPTQPWVSPLNPYGFTWFNEVRLMLENGSLTWDELENEIRLGYFRPSLPFELRYGTLVPGPMKTLMNKISMLSDNLKGYKPHKVVYERRRYQQSLMADG